MTAHLKGFDQRLFGENADVLLTLYVWNVGHLLTLLLPGPALPSLFKTYSRSERISLTNKYLHKITACQQS